MKKINFLCASTILMLSACQHSNTMNTDLDIDQTKSTIKTDLTSCIRTVLSLDEGRWDYMGTIARMNGTFRTYQTTSLHASVGPDTWSAKSFGGDIDANEANAETGLIKLVGASVVPFENGQLNHKAAVKFSSCTGPDQEGRYQVTKEYQIKYEDGTTELFKNLSWYSEHGSYYAEDIFNQSGRVVARRSGVYTPANK